MERRVPAATGQADARWDAFAAREPYFAVLTAQKFLRANLTPESEREFFASGEALVDWMFRFVEQVSPGFSPMSMLEYGCGPGRLAIPLARRPGAVVAVDRSAPMLDAAWREAHSRGVTHIEFQTPRELFSQPRKFDFISCVHVLQRLPRTEGCDLLQALLDRLATGGVGVFHVPFRTSAGAAVRSLRWMREHVPGTNALVNALRSRPASEPFIPAHVYDLDRVLRLLDDASAETAHLVYEHDDELSSAMIFAHVALPKDTKAHAADPRPATPPPIAVRDVIAGASIEDLNRTAEQYFSSLTDWEDHLAKPFSVPGETPKLLADAAVLLHGARLLPGATVLDFGGGTGWLSRWMTQIGCRVILADVSDTALRMARELYDRVPIVGDRPAPQFLHFDGRRLGLPDASVDRIVTFDAFHHVPNPDDIVREFARVLKPGGIVAFSEPGARHSDSPMSQFEMRTYGVVENDVDVHALWRVAQSCGFRTMKLAVFHGPPFYVSLEEFEDFLAGGQTVERWQTSARVFLRNARHFFFVRDGEEAVDSRTAAALACDITARLTGTAVAGQPIDVAVTVTNTGTARWLPHGEPYGGVSVGAHLYAASGTLIAFDFATAPLTDPPRDVPPREAIECRLALPALGAGRYRVEIDCVAARVTWFAQVGSHPAVVDVEVTAPDTAADR